MAPATQSAPAVVDLKPENQEMRADAGFFALVRSAWQSLLAEILCRSAGEVS